MTAVPPWGEAKPLHGCEVIPAAHGPEPSPARPPSEPKRPNPVVRKILQANRFYDRLATLTPRLTPLAVAIWGWLWRCARDGLARTSVAKLADRFGRSPRTVRRALAELRARGFLSVVRAGQQGTRATVYRIRATPTRPAP